MAIINSMDLDFLDIKENFKEYLQSNHAFNSYDFEGSGINTLLDILAYNTQSNAMLAHTNANEMFLDSSQLRQNVVSHAKGMGYIPSSSQCSEGVVDITVTLSSSDNGSTITLARGSVFTTTIDNKQYEFVTDKAYSTLVDNNSLGKFTNVVLKQGTIKSQVFRVDGSDSQKFRIFDKNIDVSTLIVNVRVNSTSTDKIKYQHYENINDIAADTKVFFVQENHFGEYEFYFGDNVIGFKPVVGNIVEVEYIATLGPEGNRAKTFITSTSIGGSSSMVITLSAGFTQSQKGGNKEGIASIKHRASKHYAAQNRAVTGEDYKSLVLKNYTSIEDISIWGGESNEPPVYGKVFISAKPFTGELLSENFKSTILTTLKSKNVGSITPEFVDPDFTFVALDISFKYNPDVTTKTISELINNVKNAVIVYNDVNLEKYDGVLRYSNLLSAIDKSDDSIINTWIKLKMYKYLVPNTGISSNYTIKFSGPIYLNKGDSPTITSSVFEYETKNAMFSDVLISSSSYNRKVIIIDSDTGDILNANAGTIYPETGVIELKSIFLAKYTQIKITCLPNSNDIAPKFNQLVSMDVVDLTVQGEEDTFMTKGSSAASTYTTFPRH